MNAILGEELRTSIHDAIFIMDQNANEAVDVAITSKDSAKAYAESAELSKDTAKDEADRAVIEAGKAKTEADRAKDEADRAASIVHVDVATTTTPGIVKPDGETIEVEADGTISVADSIAELPSYLSKQKEKGFLESPNFTQVKDLSVGQFVKISSDGIIEGTNTDSNNIMNLSVYLYLNSNYVKYVILDRTISSNQRISTLISKDDTFNKIYVKHNGNTRDLGFYIDISNLPNGTYTLSFDILNYNQANGVFKWGNVQIEEGSQATPYVPFARPNTELTEIVDNAVNDGFISRNIFNVLDYTISHSPSQSRWNVSNDGIRLTNNYYSTYGKYFLKLNPNDTYTFSYKVLVSDGVVYTEINDVDTSTNIFRKNDALNHEIVISGVSNIEIVITGGANPTNALIYDIQLEKGSKATTYTLYAKSNVELTELLFNPHSIGKTSGSKITNGNYFKIFRIAKIIIIQAIFQIGSATSTSETLFILNEQININSGFSVTGNDNKSYRMSLGNNIVSVDGTSLPAQWYSGTAVFVEE